MASEQQASKERNLICLISVLILSMAATAGQALAETVFTEPQPMGQGLVRVYVDLNSDGTPNALGVQLSGPAFEALPLDMNNQGRCFDRNGNGAIDAHGECHGDYELAFDLPAAAIERARTPFSWVLVNWNPMGHQAPAPPPWGAPHFDFHFYIQPEAEVRAIRPGPCPELINCDDLVTAQRPVPARYVHPDFLDVGAAVTEMGNHLVNTQAAELAPGGPPFTHTWIFGAYDGHITFYEPMITNDFLLGRPDECVAIKEPAAFEAAGYYPTEYCMRVVQSEGSAAYTVSLEGFVWREGG